MTPEVVARFRPLFMPRTVAVVGASSRNPALPNLFIRRIRDFGFAGRIYPIHPSAESIEGLRAYKSFSEAPEPIDYAYVGIPAAQVPELLASAGGKVRFAQVISSGFGESDQGQALEQALVAAAQAGGLRLLGPNCMGLYTPRGKITYTEIAPREAGNVGVVSQSGGLGTDVIRRGLVRGLKFSGLVSIGNSADLGVADLLEFYLADADTRVIGLYVESAKGGRRLFEVLRKAQARKPVVILKGGRTSEGARAASSHTGSMAADDRVWTALARQTGCVLAESLNPFINLLLAFRFLRPRPDHPTQRIALFGNGGGASVLGTDAFARAGLSVPLFAAETIGRLAALNLSAGASILNPIDAPVGAMQQEEGRVAEKILEAVYATANPDALVMHLSMPAFAGRTRPEVVENLVQAALRVRSRYPGRGHFVLVLRSDGEPAIEETKRAFRTRALELGIPVYDELEDAALVLAGMSAYERFVASRVPGGARGN